MLIISGATIWSITYDCNLAKAKARANKTFIAQASLMIIAYDHRLRSSKYFYSAGSIID
jgi:hypothetical protein